VIMEKQKSFRGATMERQQTFRGVDEKQGHARGAMEKQQSFKGVMEKQKSFRGLMEKQKSFRIVMEKQLSFISGDRRKSKDSPGKRGDSPLHLAARAGNLSKVREILQSCDGDEAKNLLARQNQEEETPLYAAADSGHALVVGEMLKHLDLQTASIAARNGYDPFHIAAKQGHLGKNVNRLPVLQIIPIIAILDTQS
jgi:hypothetical protein